jgi:hypothetical protein
MACQMKASGVPAHERLYHLASTNRQRAHEKRLQAQEQQLSREWCTRPCHAMHTTRLPPPH